MFDPVAESRYPCQRRSLTARLGPVSLEPRGVDQLRDGDELEALGRPPREDLLRRRDRVTAVPAHGDVAAVVEKDHVTAADLAVGLAHDLLGRAALRPVPG